jgi:general secretion pathway protein J
MTIPVGSSGAPRNGEAGFTLVELLVALALFGLLSLALFGSVRVGMAAWTRGTARVDQVDQSLHVQSLLRRLIEESYPLFLPDESTGGRLDFAGTSRSLNLLAPTPIALGSGGRSRLNLAVERRAGSVDLLLTSALELAWPERGPQPIATVLLAGADDVEFAYFGMQRSNRAAAWHNSWSGQSALPALVRIRVRFAAGDSRIWPELLIAPRIAADVGCLYDLATDRCRGR